MANVEDNKVYQSNQLIEASYTLTLMEKRLVLYAASLMDSRKAAPVNGLVVLSVDDFAEVFGMDMQVRNDVYTKIKEAADRLYSRDIHRYTLGKNGEQEKETLRWIYSRKYLPGEAKIALGFSPTVLPYLTLLETKFTGYKLKNISNLTSFNSFRLYELMLQQAKFKSRTFELSKLRELLGMEDKYPSVGDFRRYVLDQSVKEISQHTDLKLDYTPLKKGRAITGFKFSVERNDQIPLLM